MGEGVGSEFTLRLSIYRDELLGSDVMPALVSCLEFSDVTVQTSAAEALAAMATDTVARGQFLSSGGVSSLLPLLLSPHTPLVTSALGLIRASAQSMDVAKEFCARGYVPLPSVLTTDPPPPPLPNPSIPHSALQMLTQLSQSDHSPSSVGPALQQLLNSDLSAKWWMQGHLEASDVISETEFFDPGPVRPEGALNFCFILHTVFHSGKPGTDSDMSIHCIVTSPPPFPPPPPPPPLQALSASQPFTPLSSLLSNPLYMNRPVLTANLLLREAPPTPVEATPPPAVEPSLSQSRSKSRLIAKR